MHTETNILDFINHNCLSNDVSVAMLRAELSEADAYLEGDVVTYEDIVHRDDIARQYAQAQQFLC